MKFELPTLPYQNDALEPVLSQKTIALHYGKHHQTYVTNLNNLVPGTQFENMDLEQIILKSDGAVFNNAAQVWNHTFYFNSFGTKENGLPEERLSSAINETFGSFENFKKEFNANALSLFGSGWVWLVKNAEGVLSIVKESNAGNPLTRGLIPILTFDVWEHAYYVDYENRRGDYLNALWGIIDWHRVSSRY
jgi:Fe-Mn family superoxide dismutase